MGLGLDIKNFKMKNKFYKLFYFLAPLVALLFPNFAKMQQDPVQNGLINIESLFPGGNGLAGATSLSGPGGLIQRVIVLLLSMAGIVAVMFIIVGGYWYITSAGNEEQAEKGKTTLVNAIIGIVVIILAFVIISAVSNFITYGN